MSFNSWERISTCSRAWDFINCFNRLYFRRRDSGGWVILLPI
ncbi:MAG: hypothetical protein Hyperionvirus5_14 [Hyperionvirus sp.]|uniref:Uncharacterized protein n=1 Tax=Hyperionvirus sp. TaxID=2487770 RepID=A0A3G5A7Q3_9VIRU|nr:MAG: hypothetical protein Hyperionvirus5_14 [Hyperionvirus sp.]